MLTPLHLAVISGNTRVVRKLLIKGADKTILDKQSKTATDIARENGFSNILKMLVENIIYSNLSDNLFRKGKRALLKCVISLLFSNQ